MIKLGAKCGAEVAIKLIVSGPDPTRVIRRQTGFIQFAASQSCGGGLKGGRLLDRDPRRITEQ